MKPLPNDHIALVEAGIQAAQAAGELPDFEIPTFEIKPPKKPEQGDYACPVAMMLAKPARMKPFDIANIILKHLPKAEFVASAEVAQPGFINFRLDENWLRAQLDTIIRAGNDYATLETGKGKRAQVEFLSANPTGPITIGRTRGAILGDGIARVLEAAGYAVTREYYFNNAGAQMQNLGNSLRLRYLQALGQDIAVEDEDKFYQGEYLIDFAKELVEEKGDTLINDDWQTFKLFAEEKMFVWIK